MSNESINVMYLDDEQANLVSFRANFRREFNVFTASTTDEANAILAKNEIHIAISDQKMPKTTGVQYFQQMSEVYPDVIRILLTGYTDIDTVIEAINRGQVYRYFAKPMDPDEIGDTIRSAYKFCMANKRNQGTYQKLIDENEQMEFMMRQKLIS